MNILLLGSGGREHALAWKIRQSHRLKNLYIAPGNAGTTLTGENVNINVNDFEAIAKFAIDKNVTVIVVGPEDPLVNGIYDFFANNSQYAHILIVGPSANGAKLEGSKQFAKEFMFKFNIPTAKYISVTVENIEEGFSFLESLNSPFVLKADGLAAGKGVIITSNISEAKSALKNMLDGMFGDAGNTVVIEEFLEGIEVSYFVITDGENFVLLPEAKDYKRIGNNDKGLNTGGMGSVSPVPFCTQEFTNKVIEQIIKPTIAGLKLENIKYSGFIFFGLMNVNNNPYVIEYNCRMGDPETQSVMPRVKTDLLDIFEAIATKQLKDIKIDVDSRTALSVVIAAKGYPEEYPKGEIIEGLDTITKSLIFYAGTKLEQNIVQSNGGRVLSITSLGESITDAQKKTYDSAGKIRWTSKYFRTDIGNDIKNI